MSGQFPPGIFAAGRDERAREQPATVEGPLDAAAWVAGEASGTVDEPVRLPWLSGQERDRAANTDSGYDPLAGGRTAREEYATYPGDLSFDEWRDLVYDPTWARDPAEADLPDDQADAADVAGGDRNARLGEASSAIDAHDTGVELGDSAAASFAGQARDDIAAPTGRDELTGHNPDPIRRALAEDVTAGYLSAELAEEIAQDTAAFGGLGWEQREYQLGAEAAIEDPAAYAEELTRQAPADIAQWLDRRADAPDVTAAQYTNAQAAANTAPRSDADSDDDADGSG